MVAKQITPKLSGARYLFLIVMNDMGQEFTQGSAGLASPCIMVSGGLSWKTQRLVAGIIGSLFTYSSEGWCGWLLSAKSLPGWLAKTPIHSFFMWRERPHTMVAGFQRRVPERVSQVEMVCFIWPALEVTSIPLYFIGQDRPGPATIKREWVSAPNISGGMPVTINKKHFWKI